MTDIKTWQQGGEDTQDPVLGYGLVDANTLIEGGRVVWTRVDTGYATNSTYAIANPQNVRPWGKCAAHTDNTTGNAFGNSAAAGGAVVPFNQGLFLCNNDGTISQASVGAPVYLVSDVTPTNNSLVTVGLASMSGGVSRPFLGYVVPNPVPTTSNPDGGKIPVRIGRVPGAGQIPGVAQLDYTMDPTTAYTAAFNVIPGYAHKFNPSGATFAYTFPAITVNNSGMKIAVVNVSTGTTATVAAPNGSDNIGNSAGTTTGATAAGPTGGATKVYVADYTTHAWLVGI